MRFALVVCAKDLRQRLRDRTAILVAVVVPLFLSGLVGLALGGNSAGIHLRLALVDLDGGPASDELRAFLARPWLAPVIEVTEAESPEHAEEILAGDDADAALVLRPGFVSTAAVEGRPSMEVLASGRNPFATRMMVSLSERFLSVSGSEKEVDEIIPISPGGKLRPVDFYAISMTVLFLTFTVLSGVRSLQVEVEAGAMARLIASPASARSVLGGKLLGLLMTGLLQMTVMISATSLVFGTPWGNPVTVGLLVFTSVLMAIGMTSFFMSIAGNAEQGQMLASISIFLLAVVGGQFMPPQGLPDVFDTLQRLTPNGQAARGFMDAAALGSGGDLRDLAEPLLFTFTVGVAGIGFAAKRARTALVRSVS